MDNRLPRHIAIIMDGNGRWAKKRGLPRNIGHKKGSETLRKIISYAESLGIEYLTVYAFSTENWNRPESEVEGLMQLMRTYLKDNLKKVHKENFVFRVIGERSRLPEDIKEQIEELEYSTKEHTGIQVNVALNYGGRDEIMRACRKMIKDIIGNNISVDNISEDIFEEYLDTAGSPDPDLMIRTSGELRTSNFLPWQLAYTEFYFAECHWPAFDNKQLDLAIEAYQNRQRRFGKSE